MKRTLAIAALLTITAGGTYALANSHPAAPYRTTSLAPAAELEPNEAPTVDEEQPVTAPQEIPTNEPAPTVAPRSGRAALPTNTAITTLPDGNLTAIAQGPPSVPNTNPSSQPAQAAPTVSGASDGESAAPVVWEWRSPTAENGWTQSSEGATGCWSAYGINGRPMERQAPNEVNQHNWEVMRRQGARSIDCDSPDVQAGWDPTVPLVVE
jgi:hypothetical protein